MYSESRLVVGRYRIDLEEIELKPVDDSNDVLDTVRNRLRLPSQTITHIEPLPFGGFLAFDLANIHFIADYPMSLMKSQNYVKDLNMMSNLLIKSSPLSMNSIISAIVSLDKFTTDSPFLRYVVGTESGEIYFIYIDLAAVRRLTNQWSTPLCHSLVNRGLNNDKLEKVMRVELISQNLSGCSSLNIIDLKDMVLYYGSNTGDQYILKLLTERPGAIDFEEGENKLFVEILEQH